MDAARGVDNDSMSEHPKLAGIAELRGLKDRVISRISIDFDKFNSDFGGSSQKMFILSALLKK